MAAVDSENNKAKNWRLNIPKPVRAVIFIATRVLLALLFVMVLLTAFSDEEIVEKASRIGVSGYLVKPVEQQRLRPVIEVAVAQSRRLRESRKETEDANRRLEESKLIARAQSVYAKKEHVSESDAYQVLRKTAMDKRLPLAVIAKAYLEQEEQA